MVGAIRHWATGAGVIEETKEGLQVAWLGDMLFGETGIDPYSGAGCHPFGFSIGTWSGVRGSHRLIGCSMSFVAAVSSDKT